MPASAKRRSFRRCTFKALDSDSRPAGNIHFKRLKIKDDLARPVLRISDHNANGLKDITGDIVLERNGRKERITVNDAWLQEMGRIGSTNTSRP